MHPINGIFGTLAFFALWIAAFWMFGVALYGKISLLSRGRSESRVDVPWVRFRGVARNVVMHFALLREPYPGLLHLLIFYGFMVLAVGNLFLFGEALAPVAFKPILATTLFGLVALSKDLFCIFVYIGVAMAAYRRYIIKPDRLEGSSPDATIILSLIFGIVTCALFIDVFRFAAERGIHEFQDWAVISAWLSRFFTSFSPATLGAFFWLTWWAHLILILAFLVYIPRSKHLHLIACAFNEFFRNLEPKGRMSNVDIENSDTFGTEKIEEFGWKQLLDLFACVECGRCMENCPTARSGKSLNPKVLISDMKHHLIDMGPDLVERKSSLIFKYLNAQKLPIPIPIPIPDNEWKLLEKEGLIPIAKSVEAPSTVPETKTENKAETKAETKPETKAETEDGKPAVEPRKLIGGSIKEETIWACTTCGYCIEHCPFYIEHTSKILEMRRYLTLMLKSYPSQLKGFFKNVQRNSNPWGLGWQHRGDWASARKIRTFGESEDIEWLFYLGCAGSFDARGIKVSNALCDLLDKAGISYGILGKAEKCCGETARRVGEEGLFQASVETNVEMFKDLNVKKIITLCPHCFNTLKNEYPAFGGNYEVVHHSELLLKLINDGKLKPTKTSSVAVAFHDSCYLGRYNNIYDSPRRLIASATGKPALEMPRNRDRSFCCGAGGGRMWMEETEGKKINDLRAAEAIGTGAECIVSACPYCLTMISDGVKAANRDDVTAKDIAEILNESL